VKPIPDYLKRDMPECQRLTRVLAQMDPHLWCAWNARSERYEVYGRSQSQGWAFLSAVEGPDGRPAHPDIYPSFVLADLRSRDRDPNMAQILEHNAQMVQRSWEREMDSLGDAAAYVAKAVAQEAGGALRFGVADVMLGLQSAMTGRSKAAPVGQRIYLPGMGG
jgi:hypothetical protein